MDASLTQTQLAEPLGVNRSAVAQWERVEGGTQPSISHLIQIAEMTQVAFEWLATGHGNAQKRRPSKPLKNEIDYARDAYESACLQSLRRIPARRRGLVAHLLSELTSRR
ncbi:helix-turn-helix domain-containing protein [Pseudoxanthomonas sp. PXM02]|nr:helix-turn-helix domain-containing protein [Pseudoxanthomonas sp. PXM02]